MRSDVFGIRYNHALANVFLPFSGLSDLCVLVLYKSIYHLFCSHELLLLPLEYLIFVENYAAWKPTVGELWSSG